MCVCVLLVIMCHHVHSRMPTLHTVLLYAHTVAHQEAHMPRSYQIHPKKGHLYMKKSAAKPWV